MFRIEGSLARKLEFGDTTMEVRIARPGSLRRLALLRGPDKYKVLERRRRVAQIRARHLLDLIDRHDQSERN
jgi:hypothetical protein